MSRTAPRSTPRLGTPRLGALATALLTAGAVAATPAAALAGPPQPGGPAVRVVLTLAGDPAGLARAAASPPSGAAERSARLAAAAPSPAARAALAAWLDSSGYTVESRSTWTVVARGRRPGALPPGVLSAVVDDGQVAWHPHAVPVGSGPEVVRSAYSSVGDGAGTTVATVQFSGWQPEDAATYARAAGITLAPGQIRTVPVGSAAATAPDRLGGDFEAALDVEAVLAGAPAARQLVFVAANSVAGAIEAYDAMATAAERGPVTAVSSSWGSCEPETPAPVLAALEQSLARLVAAGATVFAAAGDSGAYDCSVPDSPDRRLAVDYPASSRLVVAVGGTRLVGSGADVQESAWSDPAPSAGYAGSGGGGGLSTLFSRPTYQLGLPGAGREPRRAVPDISVVGAPSTGLGIYGPQPGGQRGWARAGGTSLGAPLAAGLLASSLSAVGRTAGVGDLHVPLYAAARLPDVLRDITSGDNLHYRAGPGYDLATGLGAPLWDVLAPRLLEPALIAPDAVPGRVVPVTAYAPVASASRYAAGEQGTVGCADATSPVLPRQVTLPPGPDRATAVLLVVREADGTCRTASAGVLVDTTPPVTSATVGSSPRPGVLALSWSADDVGSGVRAVTWRLLDAGGRAAASGTAAGSGGALRRVRPGTYRLSVSARDAAGNLAAPVTSAPLTLRAG